MLQYIGNRDFGKLSVDRWEWDSYSEIQILTLKSKKDELDMDYIQQWAARLGLSSVWKEMLDNVS